MNPLIFAYLASNPGVLIAAVLWLIALGVAHLYPVLVYGGAATLFGLALMIRSRQLFAVYFVAVAAWAIYWYALWAYPVWLFNVTMGRLFP